MAPGTVSCTVLAMALISWIVPNMLLAWVSVTSFVCGVSKGKRFSGVSLGLLEGGGDHHFMVSFCRAARETQGAILASWSSLEMTLFLY